MKKITILLFILLSHGLFANKPSYIIFGHSYKCLNDTNKRDLFIKNLNIESPNATFILGDIIQGTESLNERTNIFNEFKNKLDSSTYFSVGNHDISGPEYNYTFYKDNVGYINKLIQKEEADFIIINSLIELKKIISFLKEISPKIDSSTPNIILCHSRIWDDNIISTHPLKHDKTFIFKNFTTALPFKIDYIITGNSPGQYFGNQFSSTENKNINNNNIFWCDIKDGIICYSTGMGGTRGISKNNAPYIELSFVENQLIITPKVLNLKNSVSDSVKASKKIDIKSNFTKIKIHIVTALYSIYFWIGIVLSIILLICIGIIKKTRI